MVLVSSAELLNRKIKTGNGIGPFCGVLRFSVLLLLSFNFLVPAVCMAQSEESGYQDYLNFKKDYCLKLQAESLKRSKDPEKTQQAFVELYQAYLRAEADSLARYNWVELNRQAKAFLELKPKEPFSRVVARKIVMEAKLNRDILENCKLIDKAASEMRKYSLEARMYTYAAVHESLYVAMFRRGGSPKKVYNRYLDLLVEWMSQSKDPPEYLQRMMYEDGNAFINRTFVNRIKMLPDFKKKLEAAEEKISPWLMNMLLAEWHIEEGWQWRGQRDLLGRYEKSQKLAEKKVKLAYKLKPDCPEAPALMIQIARNGMTDEDVRTWFDRAVEVEFDYPEAYLKYLYAITPRWGGSHEAMIDFAIECGDTDRYDTTVPLIWDRCFYYLFEDSHRDDQSDLTRGGAVDNMRQYDVLPEIKAVSEKYQAYLKRQDGYTVFDTAYYRAWEFSVAYKLRQFDDAYEIYQKYGGDVVHPALVADYGVSKKSRCHMSLHSTVRRRMR